MLTRGHLLHTNLCGGCAGAALATARPFAAGATEVLTPSKIGGPGYEMSFIGSQRQTIMTGDRAAHLDLRTLKDPSTASVRSRGLPAR
jgi:hypothetical protein